MMMRGGRLTGLTSQVLRCFSTEIFVSSKYFFADSCLSLQSHGLPYDDWICAKTCMTA
jgi:hypothetical protein